MMTELLEITELPMKTLAESVFEITPKTLASYKETSKSVPKRMAEVYLKLKELYNKGKSIFQTAANFNKWLNSPAYGLGNKPPITYMSSSTGIDLVFEELVRIEFGATA
jgi:putative toxin-antitoxin system antitoxin component (TIGR02293 family)